MCGIFPCSEDMPSLFNYRCLSHLGMDYNAGCGSAGLEQALPIFLTGSHTLSSKAVKNDGFEHQKFLSLTTWPLYESWTAFWRNYDWISINSLLSGSLLLATQPNPLSSSLSRHVVSAAGAIREILWWLGMCRPCNYYPNLVPLG